MKKFILIICLACLVVPVFAQGGGESKTFDIKLTSNDALTTIWMKKMQEACDEIKEKTEGNVVINIHGNGEMLIGDEGTEAILSNSAVFCFQDATNYSAYVPEFDTMCAPYVWDNYEQVDAFTKTDTMKAIFDKAKSQNLHIVGDTFFVVGVRNVMANKPINNLQDLSKLTIRVPGINLYVETFKALGSNYQAMSMADTFNAVETGMVDGCENTSGNFVNNHINDNMKTPYLSLTKHMLCIVSLACGEGFWQTLPEEYQSIITEVFNRKINESNLEVSKTDESNMEILASRGVQIVEISDLTPFINAVQKFNQTLPGYSEILKTIQSL